MKYDVTFSCGHSSTVDLFGANKDREHKLDWYRTSAVCPECYRKAQEATKNKAVDDATAKATPVIEKLALPALEGSEKQIKWANDLRAKLLTAIDATGVDWGILLQARAENAPAKMVEESNKLYTSSAKWWIDSRGKKLFGIQIG